MSDDRTLYDRLTDNPELTSERRSDLIAEVAGQRRQLEAEVRAWAKSMNRAFKGVMTKSERRRFLERMARRLEAKGA